LSKVLVHFSSGRKATFW